MDNLNLEILNTIKSKQRFRPFSSINKSTLKKSFLNNSYNLPSVNNSINMNNNNNNSISYGNKEVEKLYEELNEYKIIYKNLNNQLKRTKNEFNLKSNALMKLNNQIQKILNINSNLENTTIETNNNNSNNNKILLKNKIKKSINQISNNLEKEEENYLNLKKDISLTKEKEYIIENKLLDEQINLISKLIENSQSVNLYQNQKLNEHLNLQKNISNQNNIITQLNEQLNKNLNEEKNYSEQIKILQNTIKFQNKKINNLKESQKKQQINIDKYNEEKKNDNYNYKELDLEKYYEEKTKLKIDLNFFKNENNKLKSKIEDIKKFISTLPDKDNINNNKDIQNKIITNQNIDDNKKENIKNNNDEIKQLKDLYEKNKIYENFLENKMYEIQEIINKYLNGDNSINIEEKINEINKEIQTFDENLSSNLNDIDNPDFLNQNDFNQLSYILLKNFEAKKITIKNFDNLFDNKNNEFDINEFKNKLIKLLNIVNENDLNSINKFINTILFINENNIENIKNYFQNFLELIHIYTEEEEKFFIEKIQSKFSKEFLEIQNKIENYKKEHNINSDYISINDIKNILDINIDIKDKYIEFLFYYMKKYENNENEKNSSIFNLQTLKLKEILEIKIQDNNNKKDGNNNKDIFNNDIKNIESLSKEKNNFDDSSYEEISKTEYEKILNNILSLIKNLLINKNKTLYELFKDSIVTISKPQNYEIITIDSLNTELNKENIFLTDIQLSCLFNKYCVNEELKALDVKTLCNDINKVMNIIQENEENNLDKGENNEEPKTL